MEITIKPFLALTPTELWEIFKLRIDVFVVEQECVYEDIDDYDPLAHHLMLREEGKLEGYLRILPANTKFEDLSLGRIVTAQRRKGYGAATVSAGIAFAEKEFGVNRIFIEAQHYAKGFYESLGFEQISDIFVEDGIPHIRMLRRKP